MLEPEDATADAKISGWKKIKTDMVSRLARSLLVGQFHDIVSPIILRRIVCDGRCNSSSSSASKVAACLFGSARKISDSEFSWQHYWRTILMTFAVSKWSAEARIRFKTKLQPHNFAYPGCSQVSRSWRNFLRINHFICKNEPANITTDESST